MTLFLVFKKMAEIKSQAHCESTDHRQLCTPKRKLKTMDPLGITPNSPFYLKSENEIKSWKATPAEQGEPQSERARPN